MGWIFPHLLEARTLRPGVGLGIKDLAAGFRKVGGSCACAVEAADDMDPVPQCSCCECGPWHRHVRQRLVVKVNDAVICNCACEDGPISIHPSHEIDLHIPSVHYPGVR